MGIIGSVFKRSLQAFLYGIMRQPVTKSMDLCPLTFLRESEYSITGELRPEEENKHHWALQTMFNLDTHHRFYFWPVYQKRMSTFKERRMYATYDVDELIRKHPGLSEDQIMEFDRLFISFCKDRRGHCTAKSINNALESIGDATGVDIRMKALHEADRDGNGIIDFEEFVEFMYIRFNLLHEMNEEGDPDPVTKSLKNVIAQMHFMDGMSMKQKLEYGF